MTPRQTDSLNPQSEPRGEMSSDSPKPDSPNFLDRLDSLSVVTASGYFSRFPNRVLLVFTLLFAVSVPHSIAVSQISLGMGLIAWAVRDLAERRFHLARTPIDFPLVCFAGLTILSSIFSVEPGLSLPKLKALTLFGLIYLVSSNLRPYGVQVLTGLLVISSLFGAGFSLMEKLWGRGLIITSIESGSPFKQSKLQTGDVIWMIGRQRVFSLEGAAGIIRRHRAGEKLDVEALHSGDPVPVSLTVTDELKALPNPLGVTVNGRSRQFRVSGFSRQFLTYAEQMQILAMLAYGGLLAALRRWRKKDIQSWLVLSAFLFALFGLTLVMTASRAVIAAFIGAVLIVSIGAGRRALVIALIATLTLGALGVFAVTSARQQITATFNDDSTARRIGYMRAGLKVIPRHPLLGVGMDSHKRHWQEWGFPGDYITHTHSTPIQIALDRGLPALASYIWLIAAILISVWRNHKRAESDDDLFHQSLPLGVFGAVIGFSLSSLTNYNFGDSEALMMLLFVVGLSLAIQRGNQSDSGRVAFAQ